MLEMWGCSWQSWQSLCCCGSRVTVGDSPGYSWLESPGPSCLWLIPRAFEPLSAWLPQNPPKKKKKKWYEIPYSVWRSRLQRQYGCSVCVCSRQGHVRIYGIPIEFGQRLRKQSVWYLSISPGKDPVTLLPFYSCFIWASYNLIFFNRKDFWLESGYKSLGRLSAYCPHVQTASASGAEKALRGLWFNAAQQIVCSGNCWRRILEATGWLLQCNCNSFLSMLYNLWWKQIRPLYPRTASPEMKALALWHLQVSFQNLGEFLVQLST